jgi:hypothetical protein
MEKKGKWVGVSLALFLFLVAHIKKGTGGG